MEKLLNEYRSLRSHAAAKRLVDHLRRHPMAMCSFMGDVALVSEAVALVRDKSVTEAELTDISGKYL